MSKMFCFQCEQTAQCHGCEVRGVCGKDPDVAALQDMTIEAVKGLAQYASRARTLGVSDDDINHMTVEALFTTVTNVDFDPQQVALICRNTFVMRDHARSLYETACLEAGRQPERLAGPARVIPAKTFKGMIRQGGRVGIPARRACFGEDVSALQELLTYGLKGVAAYIDHAWLLGYGDEAVFEFIHRALTALAEDEADVKTLFDLCMECGQVNFRAMELLDEAHTSTYGNPEPTRVRITPVKGKAILVSGHDLRDLEELLRQTENTGINIYTHGEMLPCHGYPKLKKYKHLV
ncbi:MAG: hypothetical protein PHQ27_05250, partial [Victivallales bacterium]|nr:hypothetical protein [Victivallales bacterium]